MNEIEKYKKELSQVIASCRCSDIQLRVAQVTQGAPAKLAQIKVVRKNIARALTVLNHQKRAAVCFVVDWFILQLKEHYAQAKYLPTDLRTKTTRAMRRALTEKQVRPQCFCSLQANKKTLRQQKKERAFPKRCYALKA